MEEIWLPIKGYEGYYEVSNMGRIKSLYREFMRSSGRLNRVPERILKIGYDANGYTNVILSKNGHNTSLSVHRIVALAFLPNPDNLPCVNHIDCNPANNCVTNLEWCTYAYNAQYAASLGRMGHSMSDSHRARLQELFGKPVYCIENQTWYSSRTEAANKLGVTSAYVLASIRRQGKLSQRYYACQKYSFIEDPDLIDKHLDTIGLLRHGRKAYEFFSHSIFKSREEVGQSGLMPSGSVHTIDKYDGYVPKYELYFVDIGYTDTCPYSIDDMTHMLKECKRKYVRDVGHNCIKCETTGQLFPSAHYAEICLHIPGGSINEVLHDHRNGYYKKRDMQFRYVDIAELTDDEVDMLIPHFEKLAKLKMGNRKKPKC